MQDNIKKIKRNAKKLMIRSIRWTIIIGIPVLIILLITNLFNGQWLKALQITAGLCWGISLFFQDTLIGKFLFAVSPPIAILLLVINLTSQG